MRVEYKLVGLGRNKKATLELLNTDREIFWADIDMPDDRFNALWDYCKGESYEKNIKIAEVECDYVTKDGNPVNGVMKGFRNL
jgi:hypothetical protein